VTAKPAIPTDPFGEWTRIPVATAEGSDFAEILRTAIFVADHWLLGPDGPYNTDQPQASVTRGTVREALLHLLELGFIDIDTDRLHAADWIPMQRDDQPAN
jgi:hypothetical protein